MRSWFERRTNREDHPTPLSRCRCRRPRARLVRAGRAPPERCWVRPTYTSCCGYDRGPRGVGPRGTSSLQQMIMGVSLTCGRPHHKRRSHDVRRESSIWYGAPGEAPADRRRHYAVPHDRVDHSEHAGLGRERCRRDGQHRLQRSPGGDRLGRAARGGGHTRRARRPARLAEADRQRELRLAGRAADHGHLVQRQVRRGHGRPPLLRRLPERRHRRGARRRARPRAVRRRVRLCRSRTRASTRTWSRSGRSWPTASSRRRWRGSAPRTSTSSPRRTGRRCATSSATSGCSACRLDAGGHLTHGFRPNISGKMFHQRCYGTDPETGLLDYDRVAAAAREFRPLVLIAGYSAYPRRVNFAKMREIADEVGATLMVDMAHFAGPGRRQGVHRRREPGAATRTSSPRPRHKSLRGPRGGLVLATEEYADVRGPRLPDGARRPAVARDGGQGGRARRGAAAGRSATYAQNDRRQRPVARRGLPRARRQAGHRRHRQPPRAARRVRLRAHRPAGRVGAARRGRGDQPQLRARRPERRLVHLRHPLRYAGADHPRLRRTTSSTGSPSWSSTSCRTPRRTSPRPAAPSKASYTLADGVVERTKAASAEMLDKHPLYPGLELT